MNVERIFEQNSVTKNKPCCKLLKLFSKTFGISGLCKISIFLKLRKIPTLQNLENVHDKSGLGKFWNHFGLRHISGLDLEVFESSLKF